MCIGGAGETASLLISGSSSCKGSPLPGVSTSKPSQPTEPAEAGIILTRQGQTNVKLSTTDRSLPDPTTSQQTRDCAEDKEAADCSRAQGGCAAGKKQAVLKQGLVQPQGCDKLQQASSSSLLQSGKEIGPGSTAGSCLEASPPASACTSPSMCLSDPSATAPMPKTQDPQQTSAGTGAPTIQQAAQHGADHRPGDNSKPDLQDPVKAWEESVSVYLEWQTAVCTEHRSAACCASELEKAQAFGRLILLQAMHRLSLAYRASLQEPRPKLPGRCFGIPEDGPAIQSIPVYRCIEALESAHVTLFQVSGQTLADLRKNNDQSALASEALALWRAVGEAQAWSSGCQSASSASASQSAVTVSGLPGSRPEAVIPEELLPVRCLSWCLELCATSMNTWAHQRVATPEMRPEALDMAATKRVTVKEATAILKERHIGKRAAAREARLLRQVAASNAGHLSADDHAAALERSNAAAAALMAEEDIEKAAARKKEQKACRRKQARKKASGANTSAAVPTSGQPSAGPHGTSLLSLFHGMTGFAGVCCKERHILSCASCPAFTAPATMRLTYCSNVVCHQREQW